MSEEISREFKVCFDVTQEEHNGSVIHHTKEETITKEKLLPRVQELINQWVNIGHSFNLTVVENNSQDKKS